MYMRQMIPVFTRAGNCYHLFYCLIWVVFIIRNLEVGCILGMLLLGNCQVTCFDHWFSPVVQLSLADHLIVPSAHLLYNKTHKRLAFTTTSTFRIQQNSVECFVRISITIATSLLDRIQPGPRMPFSVHSGVCLVFLTTLLSLPEQGECGFRC